MDYSEKDIKQYLNGAFGRELVVYDTIGSTNDAAKLLAKNGAPHGAVVVAKRQTAGKGRMGRSFHSPPSEGVYVTLILRPELTAECALLVTSAAAVATARAIEAVCGVEVKIKWVNDLYLNGRKLCGILAESALRQDGGLEYVVVGIGVNITATALPDELKATVTALSEAGVTVDSARLIAAIIEQMELVCTQLENREFLDEYRRRSCVLGKRVRILQAGQEQWALVLEITEDASLLVCNEKGEEMLLNSGEISLRGDFT